MVSAFPASPPEHSLSGVAESPTALDASAPFFGDEPATEQPTRFVGARCEAPDDPFDDFEEDDFDDDFDDDFEEEQDEEYDAENEEYPDNDFGTGIEVDEDLGEIEIDPDIEADFEEVVPGVEPAEVDEDEGEADVVDGE
jgi:hypothetical protein